MGWREERRGREGRKRKKEEGNFLNLATIHHILWTVHTIPEHLHAVHSKAPDCNICILVVK